VSLRDLSEKYGRGSSRALVNRAIREELVGGDLVLDSLYCLGLLRDKWKARGWQEGWEDINIALSAVKTIAESMRREIRRRYQIGGNVEGD